MVSLNRLTVRQLAVQLQSRELRAVDLVEASLERIAARDPHIHAWIAIDPEYALAQARILDAGPIVGPMHGIPVGVKDIFDTVDLPTEYGSPIYLGHRPDADAVSVAAARVAGAVVLGKTATTEFACQSSAATANPHNIAHTPGGSSSGTAAAVADWMVPIGFGTQTAGSIIRPASYCGVVGYKPSFDKVAKSGVKLIAESLDTIGALARTVSDAAFFVGAITQDPDLLELPVVERRLRIGLCRTHDWQQLSPAMEATFESVAQQLSAAGARVSLVELPDQFAALGDAHAEIQGFEAVRNFASELRDHRQQLSPPLLAMLEAGSGVSRDSYAKSQGVAGQCRSRFSTAMGECDVLLTASATGEAPQGFASTGSPVMNRTWTLLHVPCVNVPGAFAPNGLPVGVQVVGRLNDDATTLAIADWIHRRLQS